MNGHVRRLLLGLLLFWTINTLGVNLLIAALGGTTTLHLTGAFLIGSAHQDSWEPMRQALVYLRAPHARPVYSALFFDRGIQFIYPPTSLLPLDLLGRFFPTGLPSDLALNRLSWLAVLGTAAATGWLFLDRVRTHLGAALTGNRRLQGALAATAGIFALTFYPIVKAFSLGQIQTWMTFLFTLAVAAFVTDRKRAAGALCGLICLVKPPLALFVVWGLLRRQRRFVQGWFVVVLPIGLISLWRYGISDHWNYVQLSSFLPRHGWSYYPNQSVNGLLNRFFFLGSNRTWDARYAPFNVWVFTGTVASSIALIATPLIGRPRKDDLAAAELADFLIAALCFTMASPLAWEHHYGILLPMFACVLPATFAVRRQWPSALISLGVPFVLVSNVYQVTARFADSRLNIVQSYVLCGGLLLLWHLHRLRRAVRGGCTDSSV